MVFYLFYFYVAATSKILFKNVCLHICPLNILAFVQFENVDYIYF